MKHLFIPYALAVIAKEKGFNEPCIARYDDTHGEILFITSKLSSPMHNYDDDIMAFSRYSAPLYQQICDWLRDEHEIYINIIRHDVFFYTINNNGDEDMYRLNYYEALNAAITEAFKLI